MNLSPTVQKVKEFGLYVRDVLGQEPSVLVTAGIALATIAAMSAIFGHRYEEIRRILDCL